MKVVAVMITWNNLEFFKCALMQALVFCDEVMLAEGCHSAQHPKHSTDGTCEYIDKIRGHPKLKIIDIEDLLQGGKYKETQWAVRQRLIDHSRLFVPGNWFTSWDDDQFFFNEDLIKLRHVLETTAFDTLSFYERRFIYNFRFNTTGPGHWFFHRITEGCYLKSLMKLCYRDGIPYAKRGKNCHLEDFWEFHYPYVKKSKRIKARWDFSIERGTIASIDRYEKWKAVSWKADVDIFKNAQVIEGIQGQGNLNIYTGKSPQILSDHPWRYINDVRTL